MGDSMVTVKIKYFVKNIGKKSSIEDEFFLEFTVQYDCLFPLGLQRIMFEKRIQNRLENSSDL